MNLDIDFQWLLSAALALGLIVAGAALLGYLGAGLLVAGGLIWEDLRATSREQTEP